MSTSGYVERAVAKAPISGKEYVERAFAKARIGSTVAARKRYALPSEGALEEDAGFRDDTELFVKPHPLKDHKYKRRKQAGETLRHLGSAGWFSIDTIDMDVVRYVPWIRSDGSWGPAPQIPQYGKLFCTRGIRGPSLAGFVLGGLGPPVRFDRFDILTTVDCSGSASVLP